MHAPQFLLSLLLVAGASVTYAGTIGSRQLDLGSLGSIQCNVARLRIVKALGDTQDSVGQIQDTTVQQDASAGLKQAQGGIGQIAQAILAGEAPPQAGRDEVEAGLNTASSALDSGDASDPAVTDSQANLQKTVKAGQDVVANC